MRKNSAREIHERVSMAPRSGGQARRPRESDQRSGGPEGRTSVSGDRPALTIRQLAVLRHRGER